MASVRGGTARPTIGGFSLQAGQLPYPFPGYTPTVGGFRLTAQWGIPGPGEGQSVLILTYTLAAPPGQVRIVTNAALADEEAMTVLVRLSDADLDPADYSTYQVAALNSDIVLTQVGTVATIALFGSGSEPGVLVQWN
jgi:hypothetical protein